MSLRMVRLRKGLTQWDVSVKTAIPQTTISLYENGYKVPKDEDRKKLAKALGCKTKEIFPQEV